MQAQVSGSGMEALIFKARREELGSQKSVALELGIGESTIQSYESGRAPIPITVTLAIEALATRRRAEEGTARERFENAARRYARAFANQHHDEMALIWANELSPRIQGAKSTKDHADMRVLVQEEIVSASRPLRVYDAALKNRGTLIKMRNDLPSGDFNRQGLDEIITELG